MEGGKKTELKTVKISHDKHGNHDSKKHKQEKAKALISKDITIDKKHVTSSDSDTESVESEKSDVSSKLSSSSLASTKQTEKVSIASQSEELSESESVSSEEDNDNDAISLDTDEIISSDVLYIILKQFFTTKDGKNITEVLDEINHKLNYIKHRT